MFYFKNKKILFVVAHPDDEVLGPGGTIHMLAKDQSCNIELLILSHGISSRYSSEVSIQESEELFKHNKNIEISAKILGISNVTVLDFPDNRFDSVDLLDIVKEVEKKIESYSPDIIFTHHYGDLNQDHQICNRAVITSSRPLPGLMTRMVLTFETPSSTEWNFSQPRNLFVPNIFVSLSNDNIIAKQNAIQAYEIESRPYPHPRSTLSLESNARRWGAVSGADFAEAFCLSSWTIKASDN